MQRWPQIVMADISKLPEALEWYEAQVEVYEPFLDVKGKRIDDVSARLAGVYARVHHMFMDLEIILKHFEELTNKRAVDRQQALMRVHQKSISDLTAKRFAEYDDSVMEYKEICNGIARVRNLFLTLSSAIEKLHYQVGHTKDIRVAGLHEEEF